MSWFKNILSGISVSATGKVADNLKSYIQEAALQTNYEVEAACLDVLAARDLKEWGDKTFANWFYNLSWLLENDGTLEALTNPHYTYQINRVITALEVSRAYYAQQANDDGFLNSLKIVALRKAIVCEALSAYVVQAYEASLVDYGNTINGKSIEVLEANLYEGTKPESFTWRKKNVVVNHIKFQNVSVDQEGTENKCAEKTTKDYLPWVISGAFFLIAWSSAARKNSK